MKKLFALLLALVMVLSLAACGDEEVVDDVTGGDSEVSDTVDPEGGDAVVVTDNNGEEVSQETIDALTTAYNAIAVPFNEIATAANENGWTADAQTAAELEALSQTLGFVGAALTEDITMLDGTDFTALITKLEEEVPTALEILSERVSVPYTDAQ